MKKLKDKLEENKESTKLEYSYLIQCDDTNSPVGTDKHYDLWDIKTLNDDLIKLDNLGCGYNLIIESFNGNNDTWDWDYITSKINQTTP